MLLKEFLRKPVAYYPILAKAFKSIGKAVTIQQLIYWSDKGEDPDGWIYKTDLELGEEVYISTSTVGLYKKYFVENNIIEIKIKKIKGIPKTHYRILWESLEEFLGGEIKIPKKKKAKKKVTPKKEEEIKRVISVNEVIEILKPLNEVAYTKWFKNKTERENVELLIDQIKGDTKKEKEDALKFLVEFIFKPENQSNKFFPSVTKPSSLVDKLPNIRKFIATSGYKDQKKENVEGEDFIL